MWYQVGVTRDADMYTFCLDGSKHGSKEDDTSFGVPAIEHTLTIAWAEDNWGFVGGTDEIVIGKAAWDERQIGAHFLGGVETALAVSPHGNVVTTWSSVKSAR